MVEGKVTTQMSRWLPLLTIGLVLLFGSGCVTEPAVKLYGARIAGVSPQGVTLGVTMRVLNDNSFDIMVRGVRTNVTIGGTMLPPVVATPQQWLPAGRGTLIQVPVVIPWGVVTPLVQTTVSSPTIKYRMVGYADVTATRALEIDFDDYKFDQIGGFSRGELVMAAGRGIFSENTKPWGVAALEPEPAPQWILLEEGGPQPALFAAR
jgi:LEA14-like dessication related protein